MRFLSFLVLVTLVSVLTKVSEVQAAPAYRASGTFTSGTGAITPPYPASMAANDVCLLAVESENQAISLTVGSENGFVEVPTWSPQFAGTAATNPGSRLALFWKRTVGGDTPPVVADSGDHTTGQIHCFSGVITSGNPWNTGAGSNDGAANDTTGTIPGSTTTESDTLVVLIISTSFNGTSTAQCSAWTNADLTSLTEQTDNTNTSGLGGGHCLATGIKASAGTYTTTTVTLANTSYKGAISLALKAAPPTVSSINTASTNPTSAGTAVSWTVVFSASVSGVDATDFALVQAGGVSGASITSVTGAGTTWTVNANTGSGTGTLGLNLVDDDSIVSAGGTPLGGAGAGNGNFTGQVYTVSPPFCSPPSNVPIGVTVTCECDTFGRASLNPSTIFGANWIVSKSDSTAVVPYINAMTGYLRLTENTGNNAKAATVPGIFPAAGNYISVEFQHFAYGGSGADGIAVTLSDFSVPAVPGAFGGSLGYAQKTGASCPTLPGTPCPGFAGGWIGVGIDEFGNYQNPTEGRIGGPGARVDSVGVRGSGSGVNGYNWMVGTATLAPGIDNTGSATPAPGYYYQVIVDARNDPASTSVTVNRDTTGTGTSYTSLITVPNVYTAATAQGFTQSAVPTNWQISFTGSTGGSTNIHEIGGLRICAQTVAPPTGGTASGFSTIDEAYGATVPAYQNFQTGHIYMKQVGTSFKLWVAALTGTGISSAYSTVSAKYASVKFVDNSDNACGPDSARTCNSTCTSKTAVEAGATQIATFALGGPGATLSPSFTLSSAWKNLIAVIQECTGSTCSSFTATAPACSVDSFSARPTSVAVASNATQTGTSGTPIFKAGSDNFSLTATVTGIANYTGTPKINGASVQAAAPATLAGTLAGTFSAAIPSGGNSVATGNAFTYSEVGAFKLLAPDGVYDNNWTAIDSDPTKNDCTSGTTAAAYSNTKDANGKFGCNFGITADTGAFGRFTPAYFDVTPTQHGCTGSTFTYSGQPFRVTVTPYNASGANTQNYTGALGFAKAVTISDPSGATNCPSGTCFANYVIAAGAFSNVGGIVSGSTYPITNPLGGPNPPMTYTFIAKETQPLLLTLRAIDTDGVSSQSHNEGSTTVRGGRIHLLNAYGSELVDLPMSMRVEYYSGATDGWITNGSDTCSSATLKAFSYQTLPAGTTCVRDTTSPGVSGQGCATPPASPAGELYTASPTGGSYNLYLKASGTGNLGSVDVTANLATTMPWLQYDWNGTGTDIEPTGRATFGLYRGSPRSIYLRERY
jgi:MSHA biogenesis protein MshQ